MTQAAACPARPSLPSSIFIALAVLLLSLSAWAFISNTALDICSFGPEPVNNEERFGCITVNANAVERQNWIAGILGVAGFAVLGVPLFGRMRTKLSTDRDELTRRLETERQLEAESKARST